MFGCLVRTLLALSLIACGPAVVPPALPTEAAANSPSPSASISSPAVPPKTPYPGFSRPPQPTERPPECRPAGGLFPLVELADRLQFFTQDLVPLGEIRIVGLLPPTLISDLASLRSLTQSTVVPACGESAKEKLLAAMDENLLALAAFRAKQDWSTVYGHLAARNTLWFEYRCTMWRVCQ